MNIALCHKIDKFVTFLAAPEYPIRVGAAGGGLSGNAGLVPGPSLVPGGPLAAQSKLLKVDLRSDGQFGCLICGDTLNSEEALKQHVQVKEGLMGVPITGHTFFFTLKFWPSHYIMH